MPTDIIPSQATNLATMIDGNVLHGEQAGGLPYLKEMMEAVINGVNSIASESSVTPGAGVVGVKTAAYTNIDPGVLRTVSAILDQIDAKFTSVGGAVTGSPLSSLELAVSMEKQYIFNNVLSAADCMYESYAKSSTGRLEVSANVTVNTNNTALEINSGQLSGYAIKRMYMSKAKTLSSIDLSHRFNTPTYFDVSIGNSTIQTVLTSTTNRSSEYKTGDVVWFIPMYRIDLGSSVYTEWVQGGDGYRVTLTSDGTGTTDITLAHTALATSLPTYSTTFKHLCVLENVSTQTSLVATPTTAESFTVQTPNRIAVGDFGISYPSYVHSHWKMDDGSGGPVNSRAAATYNLTQQGTVPSTAGKFGLARGPFTTSNYFNWAAGGASNTVFDTTNFAVECWFKTSDTTGANRCLITKLDGGWNNNNHGWAFYVTNGHKLAFTGFIFAGGSYFSLASAASVNDGLWHHALGVNMAGTGNCRLYLDGVMVAQATSTGLQTSGSDLQVGNGTNLPFLGGLIDSAAYWTTLPTTIAEVDTIAARRYASGVGAEYGSNPGFNLLYNQTGITTPAQSKYSLKAGVYRTASTIISPQSYGFAVRA